MKAVAISLARELGPAHHILSSFVVKQTPQRTLPLLQLIELYVKVKGEQAFIEGYYEQDALYENGFLKRYTSGCGWIQIYHCGNLLAAGQI